MGKKKVTSKGDKELSPEVLQNKIFQSLCRIDKMSFLEKHAIFMGKTQIVEIALKNLLINKCGYSEEHVERRNLGWLIKELKSHGLREDFVRLLEDLKKYRNLIAHELLAVDAIGKSLIGADFERLSWKQLRNGLFTVEQVIHIYDYLAQNDLLIPKS